MHQSFLGPRECELHGKKENLRGYGIALLHRRINEEERPKPEVYSWVRIEEKAKEKQITKGLGKGGKKEENGHVANGQLV